MATRRERVVLELEDQFTSRMARAAAITAVLNKELDSLSRESVKTQRSFSDIDRSASSFGRGADKAGSQIDRLSGRLRVLTDVATLLAPAGVAIGAVAVPAITALASQLGFASFAAGTAVIAFQGIGDTLKALDKAALDPTRENLDAANLAMQKLSPAAREFAQAVRDLIPEAQHLRDVAATGLFPGVVEGLEQLEGALPRVEAIVAAVSSELGQIAADTGASLASDRWAPFLEFIAREAPDALGDMADAAGNVAHGLAEMWMAFQPVNSGFSDWLVEATEDLDRWATGLSKTEGFHEFVDFIQTNGPRVADTFAAIANAVLQIVEATAPLSGPVLVGIEALANAVAAIADSDLGTPLFAAAAALALFNRTMGVVVAGRNGLTGFQSRLDTGSAKARTFGANVRLSAADLRALAATALTAGARTERELLRMNAASARLRTNLAPIGKGAAVFGGLAIAATGAADSVGLTNTASLALAGSLGGAPGALAGGLIGSLLDARAASEGFRDTMRDTNDALQTMSFDKLRQELFELKRQREDLTNVTGVGDFFGDLGTQIVANPLQLPGDHDDPVAQIDAQIRRVKASLDDLRGTSPEPAAGAFFRGFHQVSVGLNEAVTAQEAFKRAVERTNEILTGRSTFRDYQAAVDDFRHSLEKNGQTLDTNTDKGRKNQAALDQIAASAVNYAKSIDDPRLRTRFLDNARDQYIKAAEAAGMGSKAAKQLADDIGLLNGIKGKVHIIVDADGAIHIISELDRRLQQMQRRLNRVQAAKNRSELADIRGDFWTGGWTGPGSKYQPAGVVHADEFVFSKEATNGNVAFLDALHRQLRGYADGGLVRRYPTPNVAVSVAAGGQSIDYDRLAQAMSAVRPIFGDVHLSGDGAFEREQRQRLAALGGGR